MGSNTNAHGSLELRAQNIIQQAVVVGIDLVFTQVRRDLPAVYLALDMLHGQIRAFHEANLNRRPALGHALLRKFRQIHQALEGIWQISLQNNACF